MEQLSAAQLRRAISAIAELDAITDLAEYPSQTARLLARLISCEVASYNAVDPRRRRARVAADPAESVFEGGAELFAAYAHQNPLVGHYAATADGGANRISDFISRRQLHATELYNYVYRRIGVEYQLAITLASPLGPGEVIGLTLSRGGRDFSAAEKALLEALRPHLGITLSRLGDQALAEALLDDPPSAPAPDWLLAVSPDGTVLRLSASAQSGLDLALGSPLPPPIRRWLAGDGRPASVEVDGRRLGVALVGRARPGLLVLRITPRHDPPDAAELGALGLTSRQAEVLALVARGLTSAEVAGELLLSPRTVEKHLESIYLRLGVRNRAEATGRALTGSPAASR
jgi:DNA-binding CsgD family transcriptional regulator